MALLCFVKLNSDDGSLVAAYKETSGTTSYSTYTNQDSLIFDSSGLVYMTMQHYDSLGKTYWQVMKFDYNVAAPITPTFIKRTSCIL